MPACLKTEYVSAEKMRVQVFAVQKDIFLTIKQDKYLQNPQTTNGNLALSSCLTQRPAHNS